MQPTGEPAPKSTETSAIGTSPVTPGGEPMASSQTPQYDRPPPGLAQGKFAAPAWLIASIGLAIVLGVVAFFVMRNRRDKRKQAYESIAPKSSRR